MYLDPLQQSIPSCHKNELKLAGKCRALVLRSAFQQPIRLHGMGLRSQVDNCYPAYVGAVMQAAPFLAKLPALQEVLGGEATCGTPRPPRALPGVPQPPRQIGPVHNVYIGQ